MSNILIYIFAINTPTEHLEISPILIDSLSLPILAFLHPILLTTPVEKRRHSPLGTILLKDGYTPIPQVGKFTISVLC
jgi:hypothetical protein